MKSFVSGGIGGVCVVLVGHPLDLVKVRMQTGGASGGVLSILASTFREAGIGGLYRGVSAPLIAVTPIFAVSFWGYDMGQRAVRWGYSLPDGSDLSILQKCIAGGLSAIPTTAFMAPSERVKCLLQTAPAGKYSGSVDCARDVLRTGGVSSLFRGTGLTLLRDVPGSIAWFGTYEFVKYQMTKHQKHDDSGTSKPLSLPAIILAGGLAGMANWAIAIPPDVLKSRFQSAPDGTYKGVIDVYQTLVEKEGHGALFAGLRPAMIRAFPANAACFLGMEVSRSLLSFLD